MTRFIFVALTLYVWIAISLLEAETLKEDRHKKRFILFQTLTALSVIGFFLSESILVAFIFFEVMSLTSAMLVFHNQTKDALRAGYSYLAYAIVGGMVSLMGLFLYYTDDSHLFAAAVLMLIGFAVKSGMVPLHTWLVRSYLAAPDPATIMLSSVLSKCGVFGILVICGFVIPESKEFGLLLLFAGVLTIFAGGMRGIFACEAKRILASSSMSQIGFIIMGLGAFCVLGEHGILPAAGCVIYSLNHGLIKLVLFGVVSGVEKSDEERKLYELKGVLRQDKLMMVVTIIAMLGIIGCPGFCGYVGKTLIHEGIIECGEGIFATLEIIFVLGGGLTTCYMFRLFKELVLEKGECKSFFLPSGFRIMLVITTIVTLAIGLMPSITEYIVSDTAGFFNIALPEHHVNVFTLEAVLDAGKSIGWGIIYFLIFNKISKDDMLAGKRDIEEALYRPFIFGFLPVMMTVCARIVSLFPRAILTLVRGIMFYNRSTEFVPALNENFGNYAKETKVARIPRGISYSLLLFVMGITGALLYLVIMYYI